MFELIAENYSILVGPSLGLRFDVDPTDSHRWTDFILARRRDDFGPLDKSTSAPRRKSPGQQSEVP